MRYRRPLNKTNSTTPSHSQVSTSFPKPSLSFRRTTTRTRVKRNAASLASFAQTDPFSSCLSRSSYLNLSSGPASFPSTPSLSTSLTYAADSPLFSLDISSLAACASGHLCFLQLPLYSASAIAITLALRCPRHVIGIMWLSHLLSTVFLSDVPTFGEVIHSEELLTLSMDLVGSSKDVQKHSITIFASSKGGT